MAQKDIQISFNNLIINQAHQLLLFEENILPAHTEIHL
jgi:hypothetical protein